MPLDDFLAFKPPRKPKEKKAGAPANEKAQHVDVHEADTEKGGIDQEKIELLKRLLAEKSLKKVESSPRARPQGPAGDTGTNTADFLDAVERFADWLRGRTYIRGDIDAVKQMVTGLIALDPSLVPGARDDTNEKIPDLAAFLRAAKEHDSLHPSNELLTKQEFMALTRKKQGKPLTSTDYRHLKLLKDKVKGEMRKVPLYKFLNDFLDLP